MQITLLAATSIDGFIADDMGNGNFSSPEDKARLRFFLRGNECDCFICGRKTAEEFQDRLTYKPLLVLSRTSRLSEGNKMFFTGLDDLERLLHQTGLSSPALLGGAETYALFLENKRVDRVILTTEHVRFYRGKSLDFQRFVSGFELTGTKQLSEHTTVSDYKRRL